MCPDRADDHVAPDIVCLRRVDQLDRAAEVHRLLAIGPASGPGAGGEHDGVGADDRLDQRLGLDVADDGFGADLLEVARLGGIADHAPRGVAALGEDAHQAHRDLSVPSDYDNVHEDKARALSTRPSSSTDSRNAAAWSSARATTIADSHTAPNRK